MLKEYILDGGRIAGAILVVVILGVHAWRAIMGM